MKHATIMRRKRFAAELAARDAMPAATVDRKASTVAVPGGTGRRLDGAVLALPSRCTWCGDRILEARDDGYCCDACVEDTASVREALRSLA